MRPLAASDRLPRGNPWQTKPNQHFRIECIAFHSEHIEKKPLLSLVQHALAISGFSDRFQNARCFCLLVATTPAVAHELGPLICIVQMLSRQSSSTKQTKSVQGKQPDKESNKTVAKAGQTLAFCQNARAPPHSQQIGAGYVFPLQDVKRRCLSKAQRR